MSNESNSSAPLKTAEVTYPALPAGTYASAYSGEANVFSAEEMHAYAAQAVAVQAPAAVAVPEGYALVPIEPTAGMCKAAADGWLDCGSKMVLNKAGAAYRSSVAYFIKKGAQP